MRKALLWMLLGGMVYYAMEGLWRIPTNGGWAHVSMLFVGGVCFVLVGGINQIPAFYHLSMRTQAVLGAGIVLAVEFIAGCVLNLWLHLGIWDYSRMPFNIYGQICLLYGLLWVLLMPFAVWLEDWLRYRIYGETWPGCEVCRMYTLKEAYKELLLGRRHGELDELDY